MRTRRLLPVLVTAMLLAVACRPELVVRLSTRIYADGSLDRIVDVVGRTDEGKAPTEPDWLGSKVGLALADPQAWGRIDEGAGRLRAEGFFGSVERLPVLFSLRTDTADRPTRIRTSLEIDDGVVLDRWSYTERHGDPYSRAESDAALDALIDLAIEALDSELRRQFGDDFDTAPAEALLRGEGRSLAAALMGVGRTSPGWEHRNERPDLWTDVLAQHGAPTVETTDPDHFWEAQQPLFLAWSRQRVAEALSDDGRTIDPEDLAFWPRGDALEDDATEIVRRVWGSEDALFELAEPQIEALSGYYATNRSPRIRFEIRVVLPGTLLETNGTPDGDAAVWLFRERELGHGDLVLRARSVQPNLEALTALGARRDLSPTRLLHLADLIFNHDRDGVLKDLLRRAVEEQDLDGLRKPTALPDELEPIAAELADLLDPSVPLPSPLS